MESLGIKVFEGCSLVSLSVSDFQGFESYRPSAKGYPKPPVSSFSTTSPTFIIIYCCCSTLSSSVFDCVHTPFSLPCFVISANWTPPLLSGPGLLFAPLPARLSTPQFFPNKYHQLFSHSRFRHHVFTLSAPVQRLLIINTVGRIICRPILLVPALRSFESLIVQRDF